MKKIILALLLIYPQTPVYSETYSSKYSFEIMGRGKLLHVDDSGTFYMQYKKEIHVCCLIPAIKKIKSYPSPDYLIVNCAGTKDEK